MPLRRKTSSFKKKNTGQLASMAVLISLTFQTLVSVNAICFNNYGHLLSAPIILVIWLHSWIYALGLPKIPLTDGAWSCHLSPMVAAKPTGTTLLNLIR